MTIRIWTIAIDPTFGIGAPEDFPPDSDAERPIHVVETAPVVEALTELLEAATDSISYVEEQMEGQHASSIHDAAEATANRLAVACMEARALLTSLSPEEVGMKPRHCGPFGPSGEAQGGARAERFRVALVEIEAEDSQPDAFRTTGRCAKIAREALEPAPPPPAQGEARFGRVHGGEKSDGTCTCPECRGGMKVETVPDPPAQEGRVWLGRSELIGWVILGQESVEQAREAGWEVVAHCPESALRESEERANTFELVLSDLEQYSEKLEARVARLREALVQIAGSAWSPAAVDHPAVRIARAALTDQPESARTREEDLPTADEVRGILKPHPSEEKGKG